MSAGTSTDWWASLTHGGLLIGPSALQTWFPQPAASPTRRQAENLRRALARHDSGAADGERVLLAALLEDICGFAECAGSTWLRGNQVPSEWTHRSLTGEAVKPRWLWQGQREERLPVFVDTDIKKLGIGRGRRTVSRVLEWLRAAGEPLALITNLRQWRIVYAGLDFHAWAQSDTDLWFEAGEPGAQVIALRTLLSPSTLTPGEDGNSGPLLAAIGDSRKGQAELSAVLGERVREAVEKLIDAHGEALGKLADNGKAEPREIYRAATRIVMRLVVILFAEARDLLPRDNPIYYGSYSLEGLRDSLLRVGGDSAMARLRNRFGAWPRILALFRLVREGSHHPDLEIPRYGGELFAPGDPESDDGLVRALAVFEDAGHGPSDAVVYRFLDLLTRSRVRVRQGKQHIWIETAVDFSNLSSEYIGIVYEGLLDFELRRSEPHDPMVFVAVGKEPALPLSRLEAMDDKALKALFEKLKKDKDEKLKGENDDRASDDGEDADEGDAEDADADAGAEAEEDAETDAPEESPDEDLGDDDAHAAAVARAQGWARRAVEITGLVRKSRSGTADAMRAWEAERDGAARRLIRRVVTPGDWFLVRWGGTRKGAGTFYTRPQLAVPTVQHTLRPLACTPPEGTPENEVELLPPAKWQPRPPEAILALKVCDPAMGSGSFLVGALRYLTDVLYESLFCHGRIREEGDKTLVALLEGAGEEGSLSDERLPGRPDDEQFEPRLRARLKRYVVERCLYGVDIDPLAVELARLALWVETMDRDLPFEFLDHKLKVGNSLIGTWFDRFHDYPIMAFGREGGDSNHNTSVHHPKEMWAKAIKAVRKALKPELADWITGQGGLFQKVEGEDPATIHAEALAALERIHCLPPQDVQEKAAAYRENIVGNAAIARLKDAMDAWCAVWFWPPDNLDNVPRPATLDRLPAAAVTVVRRLAQEYGFFHWELEFPDVFTSPASGFDAVLGNPPWDIQKPNSREYFSNIDPLYRSYGKQEALRHQRELFTAQADAETGWLHYNARFKALSNWCKHAANPFGDPEAGNKFSIARGKAGDQLHDAWGARRAQRSGYTDPAHPFRHQAGGDINTYKLFLETAHALLRADGRMGMIVPSGIYTDKGTTDLRSLFITRCRWHWLFGFENREPIFDIHRSFKFGPVIVRKGGETSAILTAFMHRHLADWEQAARFVIPYPRAQIEKFSPWTRAILEIRNPRDLEVLDTIYSNAVLLGGDDPDGWGIQYATEFHMTNDSSLFKPRPWWEERGYVPDEYGRWIGPEGDVALPLYQGVMIWQYDMSAKQFPDSGRNNAAWVHSNDWPRELRPKFLMGQETFLARGKSQGGFARLAFRDLTNSTNKRTMIASLVPVYPCGNKVPTLAEATAQDIGSTLALCAILNSYVLDFVVRQRFSVSAGAGSLNRFFLVELPLIKRSSLGMGLSQLAARLSLGNPSLSTAAVGIWRLNRTPQRYAYTKHERARVWAMIEALVATYYRLNVEHLAEVVAGCDHPADKLADRQFAGTLNPKGFWRIDKALDPELRRTVLTIAAFRDLQAMIDAHGGDRDKGIEAFCSQNDGEGWMLPETLCLADLGLGHDERAKHPQPVRERMGPRFLDWQLEQSIEESWAECERHARALVGDAAVDRILSGEPEPDTSTTGVAEETQPYDTPRQGKLL